MTNSFWVPPNSSITSLTFEVWVNPGVTLTSVDAQFGTTAFGGSPETLAGLSGVWGGTKFGFDVYNITADFPDVPWSGDGWLTLSNACTNAGCSASGGEVYWEENSGVGCFPTAHCPSLAFTNASLPGSLGCASGTCAGFPGGAAGQIYSEDPDLIGYTEGDTTPEPSSLALFGSGILGLGGFLRKRLRQLG